MGWIGLYYVNFQSVAKVGLLGRFWHIIVHTFHILAKERSEVLQHLLGFLWLSALDGVFPSYAFETK